MSVDAMHLEFTELSGDTITLHPERCLNARFRAARCTRCADACPADGAISVNNGIPAMNNEACLHCGLCLHHCPTGAFSRPSSLPEELLKTVVARVAGPVDLICPQHPTPDRGPAPQAVQTGRCLASLSPAALLELSTQGRELWLDDTYCADCPLGKVHHTLAHIVAEANGWGSLLDNSGPIFLRTGQDEALPLTKRAVYNVNAPPFSRRALLGSLRKMGHEVAIQKEAEGMVKAGKAVPVSERLPRFVPPQRAKILAILNRNASSSQPSKIPVTKGQNVFTDSQGPTSPNLDIPIFDILINLTRCTACTLCARFCPTGALTFLTDGQEFGLVFQPSLCLGPVCKICEIACPEQAVSNRPATSSPDVLAKKPLAAGALAPCQRCQQPMAKGPNLPSTCFACRPDYAAGKLAIS